MGVPPVNQKSIENSSTDLKLHLILITLLGKPIHTSPDMNTVKSFWVGWGALCVAGGGAYYFAKKSDSSGSPSQEASLDPAPTRHAPDNEGQRVREKSKYETAEPFRAKKGDRFS